MLTAANHASHSTRSNPRNRPSSQMYANMVPRGTRLKPSAATFDSGPISSALLEEDRLYTMEHYACRRRNAFDCLRLAQTTATPRDKAVLVGMAQTWVNVAFWHLSDQPITAGALFIRGALRRSAGDAVGKQGLGEYAGKYARASREVTGSCFAAASSSMKLSLTKTLCDGSPAMTT